MRNGDVLTKQESIYWSDPNVFEILELPTLHGDLDQALLRPDGVVLTRGMAIKYFNEENVVGRRIEIGGQPMTVNAVIRDLPEPPHRAGDRHLRVGTSRTFRARAHGCHS